MEVLPYSGERGTNKKPYYSQRRNKRNVWKREGDTTAKPERNDNRKERLCKFWASGNCVKVQEGDTLYIIMKEYGNPNVLENNPHIIGVEYLIPRLLIKVVDYRKLKEFLKY
uniref:LysM domain-containing protein n=2 Tax=Ficus carica TaxID=3494 RepID=A0AA88E6G3_FICCA|nr:hypothetical protein TIFTF001_038001 [Ficus carica]